MDMGMGLQLLTPSMQHAEEDDLRPEMLGIASDFQQGFGTGTEEQAVEELLILQGEGRQPMRKGEDEVGVRGGQDFAAARLNPTVAGVGLALGAVSIAAAVVRDDAMPATGALIQVPTQDGGAAALDRRQDLAMLPGEPMTAVLDEFLSRGADQIGHLQGWSSHLGVRRWFVFLPRGRQDQRVQRTGGSVEVATGKVYVEAGLFQILVT